jgi:hypothetical protein
MDRLGPENFWKMETYVDWPESVHVEDSLTVAVDSQKRGIIRSHVTFARKGLHLLSLPMIIATGTP